MRVMPYSTHRGAMLLGDAPVGSPFEPRAAVPAAQPIVPSVERTQLTRRFPLTSGDTGFEEPSRLTLGVERGWVSSRFIAR